MIKLEKYIASIHKNPKRHLKECLRLAEEAELKEDIYKKAYYHLCTASCYLELNNDKKAITVLNKLTDILKHFSNEQYLYIEIMAHSYLAVAWGRSNTKNRAIEFARKTISLIDNNPNSRQDGIYANCHNIIGVTLINYGDSKRGLDYLLDAYRHISPIKNDNANSTRIYNSIKCNIGLQYDMYFDQPQKAINYLLEPYQFLIEKNELHFSSYIGSEIIKFYGKLKQHKEALDFYKAYEKNHTHSENGFQKFQLLKAKHYIKQKNKNETLDIFKKIYDLIITTNQSQNSIDFIGLYVQYYFKQGKFKVKEKYLELIVDLIDNKLESGILRYDQINFIQLLKKFVKLHCSKDYVQKATKKLSRQAKTIKSKYKEDVVEITNIKLEAELSAINLIQEKQVNKKLLQINENLKRFNSQVSHDLQAPLRTITNFTQLIKRNLNGSMDEEQLEWFEFIDNATIELSGRIKTYLKFIELGAIHDFKQVDLEKVYSKVIKNLNADLKKNKIKIEKQNLPSVDGEANLLESVLQNIISNSIKYGGKDSIININVIENNKHYEIHIRDNGPGINDPSKAFNWSYREQSEIDGSGFGLAIVEQIIIAHHGKIWIESELGEYTDVIFTLLKVDLSNN